MNGDATQPGDQGNWRFKPDAPDPQPTNGVQSTPPPQAPVNTQQPVAYHDPAVAPGVGSADVQLAEAVVPVEGHPEVSWTADEFVAHEKSPLWYLALVVVTAGLAALVFFTLHDKFSTTLIVIIGIIFGYTAGRKPRSLQYLLDSKGITINRAFRPYSDFKSFAVVEEDELNNIIFMPMQRFTLPLSLSVGTLEVDNVVTKLSDYLPNDQTHGHDALDRFTQRLHF